MLINCGRSHQETAQQSEPLRALESRLKQLELKITTAKPEWRQNEPIVVTLSLINKGEGHVIVADNTFWKDYRISVVKENSFPVRKIISLDQQTNQGVVSFRSLAIKPGETIEIKIPLSEYFEINRKGLYRMTVRRRVGIHGIIERELISNTATISVVE